MKAQQTREQALKIWINDNTPFSCNNLDMISGDASFRRYFRFMWNNQSIIAVDAPPEFEDCSKFIDVATSYKNAGVNVPEILAVDVQQGFYCQQDFGDVQFSHKLDSRHCGELYQQALACIPAIQSCVSTNKGPLPLYDDAFVKRELSIFTQWLLAEYLQLKLSNEQQVIIDTAFLYVTSVFLSQPMSGVHRDFHSRNLMIENNQIAVIDFQDAVVGPITYDAVSLLRDCYQAWPANLVDKWILDYHQRHFADYEWAEFKLWFDITGVQRHIKASGIFARLFLRDNKPVYLTDIPRTLQYIIDIGREYNELLAFSKFVQNTVLPAVLTKQQGQKHDN